MNQKYLAPLLFINLNIFNILDKFITFLSLHNPRILEVNPIVQSVINQYGLPLSMILYMIFAAILLNRFYFILMKNKGKYHTSPETILIIFNIIFYFIVANNIYQSFTTGMTI